MKSYLWPFCVFMPMLLIAIMARAQINPPYNYHESENATISYYTLEQMLPHYKKNKNYKEGFCDALHMQTQMHMNTAAMEITGNNGVILIDCRTLKW